MPRPQTLKLLAAIADRSTRHSGHSLVLRPSALISLKRHQVSLNRPSLHVKHLGLEERLLLDVLQLELVVCLGLLFLHGGSHSIFATFSLDFVLLNLDLARLRLLRLGRRRGRVLTNATIVAVVIVCCCRLLERLQVDDDHREPHLPASCACGTEPACWPCSWSGSCWAKRRRLWLCHRRAWS